jgi:hypothetical protein
MGWLLNGIFQPPSLTPLFTISKQEVFVAVLPSIKLMFYLETQIIVLLDDILLLAQEWKIFFTLNPSEVIADTVIEVGRRYGLKINVEKSEVKGISRQQPPVHL